MINKKELMLGNVVNYTINHVEGGVTVKRGYVTSLINNKAIVGWNNIKYCNLSPIPLTRELLLECGFSNDDDNNKNLFLCLSGESEFIEYDELDKKFYVLFADGGDGGAIETKVKYLHQLQNLYYAITGCELDVDSIK